MKIKSIRIENYRSIKNVFIDLSDCSVLIGPNDHGKTNILKAIRDFFQVEIYKDGKDYYCRGFYKKNKRIGAGNSALRVSVYLEKLPMGMRLNNHQKKEVGIALQFYANGKVEINSRTKSLEKKDSKVSNKKIVETYEKLRDKVKAFYIPTFRNIEDHLYGSEDDSVLFKLLSEYLGDMVETKKGGQTKEYKSIKKIKNEVSRLVSRSFKDIKNNVNKYIPSQTEASFAFKFLNPESSRSEESDISRLVTSEVYIIDSAKKNLIRSLGSGIQQAITIGLIEKMVLDQKSNNLLLFEEPETFLHPNAQREIFTKLRELTEGSKNQLIFSTHSQAIADETKPEEIILVRKRSSDTLTMQYREDKFFDNAILIQLKAFNNFRNSSVFFSRLVLFVEGVTDKFILENLMRKYSPEVLFQISIVPCGGNTKFMLPVRFLSNFKDDSRHFRWVLLTDKDTVKKKNVIKELKKIPTLSSLDWEKVKEIADKEIPKNSGVLSRETIKKYQNQINQKLGKRGVFVLQADIEYSLVSNSNMDTVMNMMNELFPECVDFFEDFDTPSKVAELIGSKGPNSDWTSLSKDQRAKFKNEMVHSYISTKLEKDEVSMEFKLLIKYLEGRLKGK